ncbi:MAG: GNAT family N-acetyltransferase [Anaerolineae bacterium]|jgi:ribosomal protein S18 acetylase RimI-like enzyme|nr:GNAT family N-acetyltransferase [Anaerolineae bacterium]
MIVIRPAQEADAAALATLATEFTGLLVTPDQMRARLQRSRGIEHPFIAELEGTVVGFASLRLLPYLGEDVPYAEISELFVTQCCRRQGIARTLMAEMEAVALAAGATGLTVLAAPDNTIALAVYRSAGFEAFAIGLQKWFGAERPYR